jgi:hypothetical protein
MAAKKRTEIQVKPNRKAGTWEVCKKGVRRPASSHRTKAIAVKRGRRLAKRSNPGQIKIFGRNGRVQATHKYD